MPEHTNAPNRRVGAAKGFVASGRSAFLLFGFPQRALVRDPPWRLRFTHGTDGTDGTDGTNVIDIHPDVRCGTVLCSVVTPNVSLGNRKESIPAEKSRSAQRQTVGTTLAYRPIAMDEITANAHGAFIFILTRSKP